MKKVKKLKPFTMRFSGRDRALLRQSYLYDAGYTDRQIVMALISAPLWHERRDKAKREAQKK